MSNFFIPKEHGAIPVSPIPVEVKRKETELYGSSHFEIQCFQKDVDFKRSTKDSIDCSRSLGQTFRFGLEIDDKIKMIDGKGRKLHV